MFHISVHHTVSYKGSQMFFLTLLKVFPFLSATQWNGAEWAVHSFPESSFFKLWKQQDYSFLASDLLWLQRRSRMMSLSDYNLDEDVNKTSDFISTIFFPYIKHIKHVFFKVLEASFTFVNYL